MPLHIPKIAQAGYWFHPPIMLPKGTPTEFVVETTSHEWLYLGRYLGAPLDSEDMRLSKWIELDVQTKTAYCAAVSQTLKEQNDQQVSSADKHRQLGSGSALLLVTAYNVLDTTWRYKKLSLRRRLRFASRATFPPNCRL
ncbi:hypothetical protein DFS33DRAFT_1402743 [Desarmillaria ectypa]|nr:hypothetical protein DFS33DRAFT_1402743 [Desarmillaria ectypa]